MLTKFIYESANNAPVVIGDFGRNWRWYGKDAASGISADAGKVPKTKKEGGVGDRIR